MYSFQYNPTLPRSDQIRSVAQSCPTLCDPMNRSTPGLLVHHQLPEFTQTHVHRVSDAIQPSHPLSSPSPPAPNPPSSRVFSNESTLCMRWPKHWSFSFSIIPSKEIPRLISFRMDCSPNHYISFLPSSLSPSIRPSLPSFLPFFFFSFSLSPFLPSFLSFQFCVLYFRDPRG